MQFRDRHEAGQALAEKLQFLKGEEDVLILAIPRGGVVVAYEIARELLAPLDVYITRKIGAPYNPELALGAIASDGNIVLDHDMIERLGVSSTYLEKEKARQRKEIERQLREYRGSRPSLNVTDKIVVLVDDGVATGATTLASIRALKRHPLSRLILATPVAPPEVAATLRKEVDQVIILSTPEHFWAVGAFYLVFDQTSDEQVIRLLQSASTDLPGVGRV